MSILHLSKQKGEGTSKKRAKSKSIQVLFAFFPTSALHSLLKMWDWEGRKPLFALSRSLSPLTNLSLLLAEVPY